MSYFKSFPKINYRFGNNSFNTKFQNLMIYVDIIDQIKDNASFYTYHHILEGNRPDHESYLLYETTAFYWTFFLLNDHLRISGWPMTYQEIEKKAKKEYSNTVLVTQGDLSTSFLPGSTVFGLSSGATAKIIRRRLNYGQIFVEGSLNFKKDEIITTTENEELKSATLIEVSSEYNALHHYEDSDGSYVDDVPYDPEFIASRVTFFERMIKQNDELKKIKVLKPQVASQIFSEYQQIIGGS